MKKRKGKRRKGGKEGKGEKKERGKEIFNERENITRQSKALSQEYGPSDT